MAEIKLIFRGDEFVIPESKAFAVGELVEDIATLPEVFSWMRTPRYFKMARCLGAMLRFAGSRATDEEIHAELMAQIAERRGEDLIGAIYTLTSVLMHGAPAAKSGDKTEKQDAS